MGAGPHARTAAQRQSDVAPGARLKPTRDAFRPALEGQAPDTHGLDRALVPIGVEGDAGEGRGAQVPTLLHPPLRVDTEREGAFGAGPAAQQREQRRRLG